MVMAAHLPTSIGSAKSRLRDRIISTYQQAQRIIMATSASPPAKMHSTMPAYAKACDHMRSDILQASKLFPDTDALLTWLLDDLADEVMSEQDRISLALIVRTMTEERRQGRPDRHQPTPVQSTESQI
jgi:hypothetical protein